LLNFVGFCGIRQAHITNPVVFCQDVLSDCLRRHGEMMTNLLPNDPSQIQAGLSTLMDSSWHSLAEAASLILSVEWAKIGTGTEVRALRVIRVTQLCAEKFRSALRHAQRLSFERFAHTHTAAIDRGANSNFGIR
jgi:hypothetical protein